MGHANRPGQHYAVSLDSQPRRICLSACRRCQSNSNTDRIANSYGYADANSHCNGDVYTDSNTYCNGDADINTDTAANTHAEITANAETSPDAAAAPVSAASKVISDSLNGGPARPRPYDFG
jgi:hypothetical protein